MRGSRNSQSLKPKWYDRINGLSPQYNSSWVHCDTNSTVVNTDKHILITSLHLFMKFLFAIINLQKRIITRSMHLYLSSIYIYIYGVFGSSRESLDFIGNVQKISFVEHRAWKYALRKILNIKRCMWHMLFNILYRTYGRMDKDWDMWSTTAWIHTTIKLKLDSVLLVDMYMISSPVYSLYAIKRKHWLL